MQNITTRDIRRDLPKRPPRRGIDIIVTLVISIIVFYVSSSNWLLSIGAFILAMILWHAFFIFKKKVDEMNEVKRMEAAFPEFLELMSSNLRAGMTIDKALLLSSREEFAPLDKEIMKLGKDLVTGKEVERALNEMAMRIKSDKIHKTITLLISGIRSGGNLATLLQETATNLRERGFVEKRAASNVLMYVIFVVFAIAVGAPLLFALSTVLVDTLTQILSTIPAIETSAQLPFTLTKVNISTTFITYFALVFLIVTNVLGSLVLGVVSKGDERAGLRFMIPLVILSIVIFLVVRFGLSSYFSGFLS